MISASVNSNIPQSETVITNTMNTTRKIIKVLAYSFTIIGIVALLAAAIFKNLALVLIGGAFLSLSMPVNYTVIKQWMSKDTYETKTSGGPVPSDPPLPVDTTIPVETIAVAPLVAPLLVPAEPIQSVAVENDTKKEDDCDLSIVIEHPKGELKEVSDALLQEVDPIFQAITPIATDSPDRPVTPVASLVVEVVPAAPKKASWNPFAKKADQV